MTEVFLVNDTRGQNNWGCRATTTALIDLIEGTGANVIGTVGHAPHADLGGGSVLRSLAQASTDRVPWAAVLARRANAGWQRARGPASGYLRSFDDFAGAAEAVDDGRLWSAAGEGIRRAHTTIVNGEGAIYGEELKGFISLFWAWYAKTRHGKRVAFVNHTADLADPEMRRAAEEVYPLLDDVSFREPVSARECGYAAPQSPDGVVPDAAYRHEPLSLESIRPWASRPGFFSIWPYDAGSFDMSRPYIAVTGSSALNRPGTAGLGTSIEQFGRLCEGLEGVGLPLVLVAPDPTDARLLAPLAKSQALPLLAPSTPLPIAHQVLAHAACLVGGRWHPGILAATGGTPLVAMTANTRKTAGLTEQLGLEGPVFDAHDLDASIAAIVERAAEQVVEGASLRDRIRERARALREQSAGNVRVLAGPTHTLPQPGPAAP